MSRSRVVTIIKNITFEVSKEFNIDLDLKFDYDIVHSDTHYTLNYDIISGNKDILGRSLTIRFNGNRFEVSNGTHSPSDYISDNIQRIICGRISERFLQHNLSII